RESTTPLRGREAPPAKKDTSPAAPRAAEYARNFLPGETLPSLDDEYGLVARYIDDITLDEIDRMAKDWYPASNRLVIVRAPDKAGIAVPDETSLAAAIRAGSAGPGAAYSDPDARSPLLA